MNKLIVFLSLLLFTIYTHAAEKDIREFIPTNPKVKQMVSVDPLNNLTYQILRNAEYTQDMDLYNKANDLWTRIKHQEIDQEGLRLELSYILGTNAGRSSITQRHLEMGEALGVYERNIWEKSALRFGPTVTGLFKAAALVVIVSTFVICPVAAVAVTTPMPKGTFKDKCIDVKVEQMFSRDDNIQGHWKIVEAKCAYDREAHGWKSNSIILPEGGPCGYLHNNNGTLVATDSPTFTLGSTPVLTSTGCPKLEGSFQRTCGAVSGLPYSSKDIRIPDGSVCEYTVRDCKLRGSSGTKDSTLYIAKAEVSCHGSRMENCDGKLVVRKAGESDSQCDLKHKDEL